jgi:hypothetical protein
MTDDSGTRRKSEEGVLRELTGDQLQLLKRVLEIERSKLHLQPDELPDELLVAVKEILP